HAARTPLGATLRFNSELLDRSAGYTAQVVAFTMELPVLQQVALQDLLKLRNDEYEHFRRFRYAVREAINQRLRAAQSTGAAAVAKQIREDLIEPELERISNRLRSAEKLLTR